MMSQQNRNLIQVNVEEGGSNTPHSLQEGGEQLLSSSDNFIQQNNYQFQINNNQNDNVDVDETDLNTLRECWSKRLLKENADLLKSHIPGAYNQYQHAKISSQDPKLMLVHGKHFCRLLDLSQPSNNVMHNIVYNTQQQELEFADFESDFLVTVVSNRIDTILQQQPLLKSVIAQPDQQTFIELRRVRNLNGHSDFVQIPMRAGVRVSRVKISLEIDARDGTKIPCIFILRKNENIVETKVIEKQGRIQHLSSIHFVSMDEESGLELQLEDIHLFQRTQLSDEGIPVIANWIALNYSQRTFSIMTVKDLLQQRDAGGIFPEQKFDPNICPSLRLFQLNDQYNNGVGRSKLTQVVSVESFHMNIQQEQLVLVRQSLSMDQTPHDIDVIDLESGELLQSAEIRLPVTAKLQTYANQKPWLRRILDCYSSDKGLYVLVQEVNYLYVYMIHPISREIKTVQVNQSQLLANPSTLEDLMAGRIIRRSVDLPSPSDVSLSVVLISQAGTEVSELDISYKYDSILQKYAEIDSHQLLETQQKLFGSRQNESSDLSLIIPESKGELANNLINNRQFKKLAEVVLMRNKYQGSAAKGSYVFGQMGTLPSLLQRQIQKQRDEDIMQILSIAKYLQTVYVPGEKGMFQSTLDTRRELIKTINLEIRKIDGIQTVYKAVLKRQNDQAQDITLQTKGNKLRDLDLIEIREIKKYIQQVVQKQANLLRILLFFVQSDYLNHLFLKYDRLSQTYKQLSNSGVWCLPKLNLLLQTYDPSMFPLQTLSDLVNLFDSGNSQMHSLQLIYYQLLSLPSHIQSHFDQILGALLCEEERRNVRAIWSVDHLGITKVMNEYQIVEELTRTKERHSHLDHLIFQKLHRASLQGKEIALMYLNSGACRSQVQLSNFETLRVILDFYANNNNLQGFIANYLRETESQIKQDLYERILESYVSLVARSVDQAYQKSLLQIQLTKKQTLIIESILQAYYPTLMITYKLSRRQVPQALGTAMRIGHFQGSGSAAFSSQQNFSKSSMATTETSGLVRDYMATLTKDQQRQAFEESKVGPAAQQEIYADISSNYKAISKIRYQGGAAAASSKESDQIFFDPSKNKQMVDVHQEYEKQVSAKKNTFTDFFGFTNRGNQLPETIKFSELMGQAPSYIEFSVPLIPEAEGDLQSFTRLFNGPVQIANYDPSIIENNVGDAAEDSRIQTDEDMRQERDDQEMQPDESDHSFHHKDFITDINGNLPPATTTSADQPRTNLFLMSDHLNSNAEYQIPGAAAIRFPTQGSSDENPSGGPHNMLNDENLLNGSSLDGLQEPFADESAHHMKIEEQQQIIQSEEELMISLDEQRRKSRQIIVTKEIMSHISEINQESDSQSNNNPVGSFGGGLNRSYTTSGAQAAAFTPAILDQIHHRNSMDAAIRTTQKQPVDDTPTQHEEEKEEESDIDSKN